MKVYVWEHSNLLQRKRHTDYVICKPQYHRQLFGDIFRHEQHRKLEAIQRSTRRMKMVKAKVPFANLLLNKSSHRFCDIFPRRHHLQTLNVFDTIFTLRLLQISEALVKVNNCYYKVKLAKKRKFAEQLCNAFV